MEAALLCFVFCAAAWLMQQGDAHNRKAGVVWDEDNLIYNESNRSATMKIDEPPTPYNKESDSGSEYDDEESSSASERERGSGSKSEDEGKGGARGTAGGSDGGEEIETEAAARAHFDQVSTALEESKHRPARRPRFSSDEDTTEDDEGDGNQSSAFVDP